MTEATEDFTDSAQSVDALLASVVPPDSDPKATTMRLFGFKADGANERLALVFVGPEAEELSKVFVLYAENLFRYVESRAGEAE